MPINRLRNHRIGNKIRQTDNTVQLPPNPQPNIPRKPISFGERKLNWEKWFSNPKSIKIAGILSLAFSVYLFLAFLSYLFTWEQDQSVIKEISWDKFFKPRAYSIDNWLGLWGAKLSDFFIYNGFGVCAFIFPFIFLILGYRLLFKEVLISLSKLWIYSILILLFVPLFLGWFNDITGWFPHYVEGGTGLCLEEWMAGSIGIIGVFVVLLISVLIALVIRYNPNFTLYIQQLYQLYPKKLIKRNREIKTGADAIDDAYLNIPKSKILADEENYDYSFNAEDWIPALKTEDVKEETEGNTALLNPLVEEKIEKQEEILPEPSTEITIQETDMQPDTEQEPELVLNEEKEDVKENVQVSYPDWSSFDPLFKEAALLIVERQQGSTSIIQRNMKLGYNRAEKIIGQLEKAGIVGVFDGTKPREVLFKDEDSLLKYLDTGTK